MSDFIIFIVSLAAGAAGGAFVSQFFRKIRAENAATDMRTESEKQITALQERLIASENTVSSMRQTIQKAEKEYSALKDREIELEKCVSSLEASLNAERRHGEEKIKMLNEAEEKLAAGFKNLANEIFDDKSKRFTEQNKSNLDAMLKPLGEKIEDFKKRVDEVYEKESEQRIILKKEIESLSALNRQICEDAENLAKALKNDSKTQGDWGEIILERLLENSGLKEGVEFELQSCRTLEDGRRVRPDVVIRLPGRKYFIVDSKVSLTSYERYCSASDEKERENELKNHIASMRRHIKELESKNYQNIEGMTNPEFVFMFVPVEPAFSIAIRNDGEIIKEAFEKNIVIVSTSTLLATLKTVAAVWRYERQNLNALEIAKQAGLLYDKFAGFSEDMIDIKKKIQGVMTKCDEAIGKLRDGKGNLVSRVEKLRELGAKTSKSLPQELTPSDIIDVKTEDAG